MTGWTYCPLTMTFLGSLGRVPLSLLIFLQDPAQGPPPPGGLPDPSLWPHLLLLWVSLCTL